MVDANYIDGIVEVYNNLGDHWIMVIRAGSARTGDFTDRIHRVATWKIHLKDVPSNQKFRVKGTLTFYDSSSYSNKADGISWRYPNI